MLDGDAMEDIVDEFDEDEIMEESGKLYLFVRYLDKNNNDWCFHNNNVEINVSL